MSRKIFVVLMVLSVAGCSNSVKIDLTGLQPLKATAPATLAPRGQTRLLASGGTRPYSFAFRGGASTSGADATLDADTGEFRAGATGRVTETIEVSDEKGETFTVVIQISPSLAIDPTRALVDPESYGDFDAVGGLPPYRFVLLGVGNADQIDELTGVLRAGPTGGRNATVRVTDSAGAQADAQVFITSNFVAGSTAMDTALFDADRDGLLDVAVATNGIGIVPLLKGDGHGSFSPLTELQLGAFPRALLAFDVDADGLDDLLVLGTAPEVLVIYRQEPRAVGGFEEVLRRPVGKLPSDLQIFSAGGGLQVAVTSETATSLEVLSLTVTAGAVTVSRAQTIGVGTRATRLAVGDFVGDPNLDLAVGLTRAPPAKGSVAFFTGDGTGIFAATPSLEIPVSEGTVALAGGDLGGGPHQDLAVSTSLSNELALLVDDATTGIPAVLRFPIPAGSGSQCQPCGRPEDADCVPGALCTQLKASAETKVCAFTCVIGDDCPNSTDCQPVANAGLLCTPQLNVCPVTSLLATGVNPRAVRVVDLDGDGQSEIAVTNVENLEVFAHRNGAWSRSYAATTAPNPWEMDVGDVNGDGLVDVVTGNRFGQNITVLLGLGRLFSRSLELQVGASPGAAQIAQLDHTEGNDVLMQVGDSYLTLLGDGRGGLRPYQRLGFLNPGRLVLGDFTGDGYLDFYAFHTLQRAVELVPWKKDLGFTGGPNASVGTQPLGLASADLNGDLLPDLLVANNLDGTWSAHLGTDAGVVSNYSTDRVYFRAADSAILPRYVLWSPAEAGHAIHVSLGKGNSVLEAVKWNPTGLGESLWTTTVTSATATYPVALDCNGDGRQDFAVPFSDAAGAAFDVQIYQALPGGQYQLAQSLKAGLALADGGTLAPGADSLGAADLDSDGDADLVLTTRISRQLVVFKGAGNCSFTLEGRISTGTALGNGVALGDLDGDGLPDLAAPLPPDSLVIYQNLGDRTAELRSVPLSRALCDPCSKDSECGAEADRCVDQLGRHQLCGRDCANGRACPAGFECKDFDGGVLQCVHAGAQCVR